MQEMIAYWHLVVQGLSGAYPVVILLKSNLKDKQFT
jgi:hypothetical protein